MTIYLTDEMIHLKFTAEMDKSFHQAHGIGYNEYCRKHKKRMEVEKNREKDYQKTQIFLAKLKGKAFL